MKSVFVVVAFCLALAFCQTPPASTNPVGEDYFSPSVVFSLPLNTTVTSTIWNSTYYTEFYWVYVPFNVAGVRYTINNTADCTDYVEVYIDFVNPGEQDDTVSFPCVYSSYGYCDNYDQNVYAYALNDDYEDYDVFYYFRPGKWQLVSVNKDYYTDPSCTYALRVESTMECPTTSSVSVDTYQTWGCIANSAITNVTTNGQTFSKTLAAVDTVDAYRLDVPLNVTRVWAWVVSSLSTLDVYVSAGYVSTDYYYTDDYSSYYSMGNGLYSYFVEYDLPDGNYPLFFSVESSTVGSYNVSFYWTACSGASAGYGSFYNTYSNASSYFVVADCTDPVVYPNVDILNANQGLAFNLPNYNSTTDYSAAAQYGYINVPAGTVGSVNFTCNSSVNYAYVAFTKGAYSSCDDYSDYVSCSYPGTSYNDYIVFLSNDLYLGGYWSVVACNDYSTATTVTLNSVGSISTAPSASPSPGSGTSPSSSPGASSSGEDSSVSAAVFPALLMIVLAAIISF
jgi:hypothetical protein